ncbi:MULTISPECIES: Mu-like prophage major head subunit gpT family protein [Sorangium]|uniref:Mu-like prophage major head subunit gpT family protein n=1 Tax=Sorangium TaxID=39643 RepID=UPI003D9C32F7
MSVQITPNFVVKFEDRLQYLIEDSWARVLPRLHWDRLMTVRPSSSRKEIISWMLHMAGIKPLEQGGSLPLEDIVETSHEIENEDFGDALEITRNDFEDADGKGIDRGAQWAKHIGGHGAYWPQEGLYALIAQGETQKSYDGVPFFSAQHPINPVIGAGAGTYPNLFTNAALTPANFAKAVAAVKRLVKRPDGKSRFLVPSILVAPTELEDTALTILTAQFLGRDGSSTDNVLRRYGFGEPIIPHELASPTEWYLGCEVVGEELPAFIYQERRAFELNTFSHLDHADLHVMKKFRWTYDGRNMVAYGHPFLFFKFKASGPGLSLTDLTTIVS